MRSTVTRPPGLRRTGAQILLLYDQLLLFMPGPVVTLHRAVAVAEVKGPSAALQSIEGLGLDRYHLFHASGRISAAPQQTHGSSRGLCGGAVLRTEPGGARFPAAPVRGDVAGLTGARPTAQAPRLVANPSPKPQRPKSKATRGTIWPRPGLKVRKGGPMPSTTTSTTSGLTTTAGAPVPLCGVRVDAEISGLCAHVEVTQRYANREPLPIEAVYVFPLDEGAAICGFDAQIDDVLVVGRIEERSSAFEEYDRAIAAGHGALLLDEERPDIFTASIGNVPPGKEVRVRIRYVTELRADGGSVRFVVPATISPRYIPAEDDSARYDGAGILTPPLAWHVPYGLISTSASGSGGAHSKTGRDVPASTEGTSEDGTTILAPTLPDHLMGLESPSHPIRVTWQDAVATVSLAHAETALDRDFVLAVDAQVLATPRAWIESAEDGTAAIAIAFCPRLAEVTAPSEVIFIVDRSGSMGGTSIAEVRKALRLCLHSMVPDSRFNIIGFGSSVAPLFPESRGYDDETSGGRVTTWIRCKPTSAAPRFCRPCRSRSTVRVRHDSSGT